MRISYTPTQDESLRRLSGRLPMREATRADLLSDFFLGDVELCDGPDVIATRVGWIPTLHFAGSALIICAGLRSPGARLRYSFTESVDEMSFHRDLIDTTVRVRSTFGDEVLSCNFEDFRRAVQQSTNNLLDSLIAEAPDFRLTPIYSELMQGASDL